jgi:hypothetical protein
MPNATTGAGAVWRIPRPPEEFVSACKEQNGTNHSRDEVFQALKRSDTQR